jgi:hypothetical protein
MDTENQQPEIVEEVVNDVEKQKVQKAAIDVYALSRREAVGNIQLQIENLKKELIEAKKLNNRINKFHEDEVFLEVYYRFDVTPSECFEGKYFKDIYDKARYKKCKLRKDERVEKAKAEAANKPKKAAPKKAAPKKRK